MLKSRIERYVRRLGSAILVIAVGIALMNAPAQAVITSAQPLVGIAATPSAGSAKSISVQGTVVDERSTKAVNGLLKYGPGTPVAGASVVLEPANVTDVTDSNGRFSLQLTSGAPSQTLTVTKSGFAEWQTSNIKAADHVQSVEVELGSTPILNAAGLSSTVSSPTGATTSGGTSAGPSAATATTSCTGWTSNTTPPSTIRVLRYANHDQKGLGVGNPLGVDVVDFNYYLRNVLPSEWTSSWLPESLKSGAMAVKTYAWYFTMHSGHGGTFNGACYDVTDDIRSQRYIPGDSAASTDSAIAATWNQVLQKSGAVFPASFQATLTNNPNEACGSGLSNYPNVLSQWGSENCAEAGLLFDKILSIYYPGSALVVPVTSRIGIISTGNYGTLFVQDGGVGNSWVEPPQSDHITEMSMDGSRIGIATTNGTCWGRDGLDGPWTELADGCTNIQVSGQRVAIISSGNGGTLFVKDGPLDTGGVNTGFVEPPQSDHVTQVSISGSRIGIATTNGTCWARDDLTSPRSPAKAVRMGLNAGPGC
jgi:Stage II sporulation protein